MDASAELSPGLAVALPFAAAAAILLAPARTASLLSVAAALGTCVLAATTLPAVLAGSFPSSAGFALGAGLELRLRVDALGATFALLAAGLWGVAGVYSEGYARATHLKRPKRFFACFAASIGSALGIAFSGNLLTFLVFYEALTVATYPLVAHAETPDAIRAARRYLGYALTAGLVLTVAAAWTWRIAGTTDFAPGGFLAGRAGPGVRAALFALFAAGCAVKAAVMPLHAWLPAAMVAPTPVSALLHAVAVVKAGVFGLLRTLGWVFGPDGLEGTGCAAVLAVACGITIVAASIAALKQEHLKRRLAYSTVANLSYIVLGGALLASEGMKGALFHFVNHGVAKITLFFCAGAVYATVHAERIDDLRGLGRSMPWTFGAFSVAALALVGLPGLCGFVGKFLLGRGAVEAGSGAALAVLIGGGVLTAAYLLPILKTAWFDPPEGRGRGEASFLLVAPLVLVAAGVVALGAWPAALGFQEALADRVVRDVFGASAP